jgi:tRNA(adenine34) deaminase
MELALEEAEGCLSWGDVPIGAVVTRGGDVLGRAGNQRERLGDPTAHAEVLAIREASVTAGSWRMEGCTLTVTLEPCAMCAGAAGFAGSLGDIVRDPRLNHRLDVTTGVLEERCADLLRAFFRERR